MNGLGIRADVRNTSKPERGLNSSPSAEQAEGRTAQPGSGLELSALEQDRNLAPWYERDYALYAMLAETFGLAHFGVSGGGLRPVKGTSA